MSQKWVFLADPETYGWDQLASEKRAVWDGIRNAVAQRNLQACSKDDEVLIYHTAPDKAAVGIARVVRTAYPDPGDAERVVVDVVRSTPRPKTSRPSRPPGRLPPAREPARASPPRRPGLPCSTWEPG